MVFADEYRAYRGVIAAGIRLLRPHTEVATSTPTELEGENGRFDPQVVVCGAPGPVDTGDRPAWVELATQPERSAKVRVGARRRELSYPMLGDLLQIIDEAEELIGKNEGRGQPGEDRAGKG